MPEKEREGEGMGKGKQERKGRGGSGNGKGSNVLTPFQCSTLITDNYSLFNSLMS